MDIILHFVSMAHMYIFIVIGVVDVWLWARRGFKCPLYIHVIALLSVIFGIWSGWYRYSYSDKSVFEQKVFTSIVILPPLLTYLAFAFYGGAREAEQSKGVNGNDYPHSPCGR